MSNALQYELVYATESIRNTRPNIETHVKQQRGVITARLQLIVGSGELVYLHLVVVMVMRGRRAGVHGSQTQVHVALINTEPGHGRPNQEQAVHAPATGLGEG